MEKILFMVSMLTLSLGIVWGHEEAGNKLKRIKSVAVKWLFYTGLDYSLAALSAVLVIFFKENNAEFTETFLAMWVFDLAVASSFVYFDFKTKIDITLGREYRRSTEVVWKRSKILGIFSFVGIFLRATVWDGPERIAIFFEKELKMKGKFLVVFFLTIFQALFWVVVYGEGYDLLLGS